jgi:tetratricopeptide (TPR) repeat protein
MPDTLKLATDKFFPDDKYREVLNQLWNKYHISFVLLRTEKNNILRKIARILTDDPNWNLVFWDDYTQIFVRKDGKNDSILAQFGTKAATPYNKDPYKKGMEDQAFLEYQRMIGQADSAKSRNALGYLLLQKGEFDKAQAEFEKATFVDPQDESPYMNLGELAVRAGNLDLAISLYQKAKTIAPDRGLIYIRLGQIMIADNQSPDKAKAIWEEGLKNVQGSPRDQLQQLLNSY